MQARIFPRLSLDGRKRSNGYRWKTAVSRSYHKLRLKLNTFDEIAEFTGWGNDMPSERSPDVKFEIGHVLFIDIVGYSKLLNTEQSEWLRHEETAAFAAGAEAQLTGELTVCAGSFGPGDLHLINGPYDCHRTRVPVVAIAAQIPRAENSGAVIFQETHPNTCSRSAVIIVRLCNPCILTSQSLLP